MGNFLAWLKVAFRSRYVLFLEQEVSRLKEDNRKIINAMMEHNGLPSLTPHTERALPRTGGRLLPSQLRQKMEAADRAAYAKREKEPDA